MSKFLDNDSINDICYDSWRKRKEDSSSDCAMSIGNKSRNSIHSQIGVAQKRFLRAINMNN